MATDDHSVELEKELARLGAALREATAAAPTPPSSEALRAAIEARLDERVVVPAWSARKASAQRENWQAMAGMAACLAASVMIAVPIIYLTHDPHSVSLEARPAADVPLAAEPVDFSLAESARAPDRRADGFGPGPVALPEVPLVPPAAALTVNAPALAESMDAFSGAPSIELGEVPGLANRYSRSSPPRLFDSQRPLAAEPPTAQRPLAGNSAPRSDAQRAREAADAARADRARRPHNREAYAPLVDNPFVKVIDHPQSTFSADVDTASYSNVRRFLSSGALPPPGAVRLEELVNYFEYDYPQPVGNDPINIVLETTDCPWNPEHRLARIGLQAREIPRDMRPASNLVFLIDVSGSMSDENKLPLVRHALLRLVEELGERDRVAIVVYAGDAGLLLPSTPGNERASIVAAIRQLGAGGSTNGVGGIRLAYDVAAANFVGGGTNRVILATDGDFNVGMTSADELLPFIEQQARSNVFLTVLGFGMGNYQDATLELLADKGNGNYAYIDSPREAAKVLVQQMCGTLVTVAKDVKIQVEFNPRQVGGYRLLGYENRALAAEDFRDDRKDAGEIGAGHAVTAMYELILPADANGLPGVGPLRYQQRARPATAAKNAELFTVKVRYKLPGSDTSKLLERTMPDTVTRFALASADFKFAAAVASFGMLLRKSEYRGAASLGAVLEMAQDGLGADARGYRAEFIELVKQARSIRH